MISRLWRRPKPAYDLAAGHANPEALASPIHGPDHWWRVASFGQELARQTPGADPHVVALFAALHDAWRLKDRGDPDHGQRAAAMARVLRGKLFKVSDEQFDLLFKALALHADGHSTLNPTIGVCWDADRLDLGRVGKYVNPDRLSTKAARDLFSHRGPLPKNGNPTRGGSKVGTS